jgi:ubiquinone biosynthesis protein UbiJ
MLATSFGAALRGTAARASDAGAEYFTLWLNHLIASEPQACARLRSHAGRSVRVVLSDLAPFQWDLRLTITPAGLFEADMGGEGPHPCLTVRVAGDAVQMARGWVAGEGARWVVEGNADLATDIDWLVKNLRWDFRDDLARLVGPLVAHEVGQLARVFSGVARGAAERAAYLLGNPRNPPAAR